MPYDGPDDDKLPSYVRSMNADKRKQWVAIFNRTMADCEGDDCESRAFANANAVAHEGPPPHNWNAWRAQP